ncbi:Uncharacterised protein [Candidatus Tiddalikarchaeum anstoanum]|nr:Uncharacterised protein [Candidatus Tiddalikarchaeum anstoanum]
MSVIESFSSSISDLSSWLSHFPVSENEAGGVIIPKGKSLDEVILSGSINFEVSKELIDYFGSIENVAKGYMYSPRKCEVSGSTIIFGDYSIRLQQACSKKIYLYAEEGISFTNEEAD